MLSDHERRTLEAIQHQLATEDPRFTGSFDDVSHRLTERDKGCPRAGLSALIMITSSLSVLMIAAQSLMLALIFIGAASWLIWLRRDHPAGDEYQGP